MTDEREYDPLCRLPASVTTLSPNARATDAAVFPGQQDTPASGSQWQLATIGVARWCGVLPADGLERGYQFWASPGIPSRWPEEKR